MFFSADFLAQRPKLAKFLEQFNKNSVFILSMIILFSSFVVFFQIGRSDSPRTATINGEIQKIGKFATPKKDDKGNNLPDQTCIVGKDSNCNDENTQFWLAGYGQPSSLFWDENYHIASAERYLQGKFFMEPHPGLGKMFIALGELILHPNDNLDKSKLIGDNNGDEIPYIKSVDVKFKEGYQPKKVFGVDETAQYSFVGVRFFPVVFAWLSALVLFWLLFWLTKNQWIAFVFTLFYTFDNAIVVHSRGAMLDGIQLFFILSALAMFVYIWQKKAYSIQNYVALGALIGLVISTKVNGAILLPLVGFLIIKEYLEHKNSQSQSTIIKDSLKDKLIEWLTKVLSFVFIVGLLFCGTYYAHFTLANTVIEKNSYSGYTSDQTKQALSQKRTGDLGYFVPQINDHIGKFMVKFQEGVPKWDPTKGAGENGSLPFTWPVGVKPIRYSAHKAGNCNKPYPPECRFSYLYLLPNMVVWILSLIGVCIAFALIISKFLFGLKITNKTQFLFIGFFASLYALYMIAITRIDRVMYMYHYFVPLTFAIITSALVCNYILENRSQKTQIITLSLIALSVIVCFVIYAPFTYRIDMSVADYDFKNWNKYWALIMDF